jgi:aminopeptidase N
MLRTVLGTKAFKEGMALYLSRHDGEAATVEQFVKAFEDASGEDLTQFSLWYHQAGTPSLNISYDYDRQSREFVVSVEQSLAPTPGEPRKRSMHIPVAFALLGHNGNEMDASPASGGEVSGGVMHVRKRRQQFRFKGIAERPIVSILRGFSAPVNVNIVQPRADLYFLARHDGDLYSRWEALMRLYSDALVSATRELRGGKPVVFETDIARAADDIAGDGRIEEAFRAQALTLPSETDLAREIGMNIDPDAVLAARNQMSTWLGKQCAGTFETLYEAVSGDTAYRVDAASAGRRALRTVMLDLLAAASGSPAAATRQFNSASNMTDRMGALIVLTQRFGQSQETEAALAQFERLYGGDALILDKWFMAQASIPGESTLARVKALTAHTAFTQDNPNRVRALIGTFASANQTGFNRPDGAAYTFYSETILSIDRANPQLAARLLTAMRSWRSLERTRRENARAALAGIAAERGISTDTREIVERILA